MVRAVSARERFAEQRREASWYWHIASGLSETSHSGPMKEIMGKLRTFLGISKPKTISRKKVEEKCDELLLVEDPSVRTMVLTTMFLIHYWESQRIGLIADLVNSEEHGRFIHYPTGRPLSTEGVARAARTYLFYALDLRKTHLVDELVRKTDHWILCLERDSNALDDNWDQLSLQEKQQRQQEDRRKVLAWAREDISGYLRKALQAGFVAKRQEQVRRNLKQIIEHCFWRENKARRVIKILEMLGQFATSGNFPMAWLIEIVNETAQNSNLSFSLKKLLVKT